jgi:hypothetical protein
MDAVRTVENEVRELIRRSQLDPTRDLREMRQLVHDAVADYDERSLHGGLPALSDLGEATKSVLDAVAGFGPLQPYLDDETIEEIWINEPSKVFVARGGTAELTNTILTVDEVRDLVERMLKSSGRRVDLSSPCDFVRRVTFVAYLRCRRDTPELLFCEEHISRACHRGHNGTENAGAMRRGPPVRRSKGLETQRGPSAEALGPCLRGAFSGRLRPSRD